MQKSNTGQLFYTIHKNKITWIKYLNVRPQSHETPRRKQAVISLTTVLEIFPPDVSPKQQQQKLLDGPKGYYTSEISQSKKDIYPMVLLICGI